MGIWGLTQAIVGEAVEAVSAEDGVVLTEAWTGLGSGRDASSGTAH